jgi:hypothetical protein
LPTVGPNMVNKYPGRLRQFSFVPIPPDTPVDLQRRRASGNMRSNELIFVFEERDMADEQPYQTQDRVLERSDKGMVADPNPTPIVFDMSSTPNAGGKPSPGDPPADNGPSGQE